MKLLQHADRSSFDTDGRRGHWVLLRPGGADATGFVISRRRPWDRAVARWRSLTLDAELAAGAPADSTRLRAVRADVLLAPRCRLRLAEYWENVRQRAQRNQSYADPRAPLPRAQVMAAGEEIDTLVSALRGTQPLAVRGLAAASLLLGDGSAALYRPRPGRDLPSAVRRAIQALDPAGELDAGAAWS